MCREGNEIDPIPPVVHGVCVKIQVCKRDSTVSVNYDGYEHYCSEFMIFFLVALHRVVFLRNFEISKKLKDWLSPTMSTSSRHFRQTSRQRSYPYWHPFSKKMEPSILMSPRQRSSLKGLRQTMCLEKMKIRKQRQRTTWGTGMRPTGLYEVRQQIYPNKWDPYKEEIKIPPPHPHKRKNIYYFSHSKDPYFLCPPDWQRS